MRGHVRTAHDAIWLLAGHLWDAQFFEGCAVTGADAMGLRNTAVLSSVQHPVAQPVEIMPVNKNPVKKSGYYE